MFVARPAKMIVAPQSPHTDAAAGAAGGTARDVQRGERHAMAVTDFRHGRRTVAQLVEIGRLGRSWSGDFAGKPYSDSNGPDASRLAWALIARQWRG